MQNLTKKEQNLLSYLEKFMQSNENNLRRWNVATPRKKKNELFSIKDVAKTMNKTIPKTTCLVVELSFHKMAVKKQKEFMEGINAIGYQTESLRELTATKNWILIH